MRFASIAVTALASIIVTGTALAGGTYERAGWVADMPIGGQQSRGVATILDERTIRVHDLWYSGEAPLVYFYLGETDTFLDFLDGIPIGPELHELSGDCMTVQLPEGQTLDGWGAISIWCSALDILFTSAAFVDTGEVFCPADVDASGDVGFGDVLEVLAGWGACPAEPRPECCLADLDYNRAVDFADLLDILAAWGPCTK